MGITSSPLVFSPLDIGVCFRQKLAPTMVEKQPGIMVTPKIYRHAIQLDLNNEYSFAEHNLIITKASYQVFYDGEHKILEVYHDEYKKSIVIIAHSTRQTNLLFDVVSDEYVIQSQGPLCINGSLQIKKSLIIAAPALHLIDTINCLGTFALHLTGGVSFSGNVFANNVEINAAFMYQSADLIVKDSCDISVQLFQKNGAHNMQIGSLRMVTDQCEMSGDVEIKKTCFLTANHFLLGSNEVVTNVTFAGKTHFHTVYTHLFGNSCLNLDLTSQETSSFITDEHFLIEKDVKISYLNTQIDSGYLENYGLFSAIDCTINAQDIRQEGSFLIKKSDLMIVTQWYQDENAISNFQQVQLSSKYTALHAGLLILNDSGLKGDNVYIAKASLVLEERSLLQLSASLLCDNGAQFNANYSDVIVLGQALFNCDFKLHNQASFDCVSLRVIEKNIVMYDSRLQARSSINLIGNLEVNKSTIQGSNVCLKGLLTGMQLFMHADTLEIDSKQAQLSQSNLHARLMKIIGGFKKGDAKFVESQLSAHVFSFNQYVLVKTSTLTGLHDSQISHDLNGMLTLDSSVFITESQIHQQNNMHLEFVNFSRVRTSLLYSTGDLSFQDSSCYMDAFLKQSATVKATDSNIDVAITMRAADTQITLEQKSVLSAENVILTHNTGLRLTGKSLLRARQEVIVSANSQVHSAQSAVNSNIFTAIGRVELCSSLLSAQEIFIYNSFAATEHTFINVEERLSFAKTAIAELISSELVAHNLDVFGSFVTQESKANIKDTLSLMSTSNTKFQENNLVVADHFICSGEAEITKSPQDAATKILTKKYIDIFEESKISGNGNLMMDSDDINQSGNIALSGNFCAKGRQFVNKASLSADNIYLGFDDVVTNHGVASCNNMTVHSNFMNIFGQVYAQKSLTCSGLASVNLGIVAANNYTNDSFFSINAGLIAPNLCADPQYIFSYANMMSVAKTAALMLLPNHVYGLQLISMIPGLLSTGSNIYQLSQKFTLDSFKTMRRHEYMPILCQVKNMFMFGQGLYNASTSFSSELDAWNTSFDNLFNKTGDWLNDAKSTFQNADWSKVGLRTAGLFAGSYTDTSLFHANLGGSFVGNTAKSSMFHMNLGAEHSLFSHNINAYNLYNAGSSLGGEANYSAVNLYNSGEIKGYNQFSLRSSNVQNTGVVQGENANVEIDQLQQAGTFIIKKGQLKIQTFDDLIGATTQLTQASLTGNYLNQQGTWDLKDVYIDEADHVTIGKTVQEITDNVAIKTKDFLDQGQIAYTNTLDIKADSVVLEQGSTINGKKTAEEQLFVPKPVSENNEKDPETEFKPQHILNIEGKKISLGGKLSGGDYTQLHGQQPTDAKEGDKPIACEDFIVEDSAEIDLKYGSIAAKEANFSGHTVLDNFNLTLQHTIVNEENQTLTLINTNMSGDQLESKGQMILEHSQVNYTKTDLGESATEQLIDSQFIAKFLDDASLMQYHGQSGVLADDYIHTGKVLKMMPTLDSQSENLFYVQAKTAQLYGSADLDHSYYSIDHLVDGTDFVAGRGRYSLYSTSDSLSFITQDDFNLNYSIERDCDLAVQAASVAFLSDYNKQHDLSLVSTVGNVVLNHLIQAKNVYVKSANDLITNNIVQTTENIIFEANGAYRNCGGLINGETVGITASSIQNITVGSTLGRNTSGMGGSGMLNGRKKLLLEATQGNIENHGGVLRGGEYTQLVAKGDVLNLCNERSYRDKYDTRKIFDPGLIAGGSGVDTDGIGLYIKADGSVFSDASDFVSSGSNYIEGVKGVSFSARQHTYVSLDKTDKKWYGKEKHVIETSTDIKGSMVQSGNGRNIIQSGEGGITSVATCFLSPGGTDVYAKGDVRLFSLRGQNHRHVYESSFWGLSKSDRDHIYQISAPTMFVDNGTTRIRSEAGNVNARGAYFAGGGDLSIQAKLLFELDVDILQHQVNEKTRSFNFIAPGVGAWNTYKNGGTAWNMIAAEDVTLTKINSLFNSHNSAEVLANSANLGIDLTNTSNAAMRGLSNGNISEELLVRYGLGDVHGFAPSVTLSMTETKMHASFQTQAQGGIDRGGNVTLQAGERIDLYNGVRVHAGGNLEIDTPEMVAHAAALQSNIKQTNMNENITFNALGSIQSVGASYSHTTTSATTYVNAEISAAGNVFLHNQDQAMHLLKLDGANILASTLDANIDNLVIKDKQNISNNTTTSLGASSSGQISAYKGHGSEKITQQHSGIAVVDGINVNGHQVHVNDTHMEGGQIISQGENHFTSERLESIQLVDTKKYNGVGISANLHDFERLLGNTPHNTAGEQTIATATLMLDKTHYVATQTPVIFGEQGTTLETQTLLGKLHTTSADGKSITQDQSMHLSVDIPITNQEYLAARSHNMQAGVKAVTTFFAPKSSPMEEPLVNKIPKETLGLPPKKRVSETKPKQKHTAGPTPDDHAANESDFPVDEAKEVIEQAMQHLTFDSPVAESKFHKTMAKAKQEKEQNGQVSHKTEEKMKKQLFEALIKTLKAGTEEQWGLLIEKAGVNKLGLKTYLGTKGTLFTFSFNLALASIDSEVANGDKLKHGAAVTAVDFSVGFILKYGAGELAGPIGWSLIALDIADTFYSEKYVDHLVTQSITNIANGYDSLKAGNYWDAFVESEKATLKIEGALALNFFHKVSSMTKPYEEKLEKFLSK